MLFSKCLRAKIYCNMNGHFDPQGCQTLLLKESELFFYLWAPGLFNFIGKKNNQTLVSDADQEIPTLGSTDNAGNEVNLVSGIILLPSVGISRSASETDVRFYLSHTIMFIHHIVFKMSAKITGW